MSRSRALPLLLVLIAAPASAQRLAYENVLEAEHRAGPRLRYEPVLDQPPAAEPVGDRAVRGFYGDRFEWHPVRGADSYGWDVSAEIGSERDRLWLATAGDGSTEGGVEYVEVQALYSRPVSASGLALQVGLRRDFVPRPRRFYVVLGVQGNVTDPLYVGAFGFLSNHGEFTGRLFTYYDLALGDRLVLQPAAEMEIAGADVPELGIGAGPVYAEAGLRLRYRLAEAFSPYVGVNWERLLGRTARMARTEGDEVESANFVLGLRSYF
jgi:copper resistance protein B